MAELRRIRLTTVDVGKGIQVSVVRFVDRRIVDEQNIQELGDELTALIDKEGVKALLINFTNVEFFSSEALGKLVKLERTVKKAAGKIKLCEIRPEILEAFRITNLTNLFDIKDTEAAALAAFAG